MTAKFEKCIYVFVTPNLIIMIYICIVPYVIGILGKIVPFYITKTQSTLLNNSYYIFFKLYQVNDFDV